MNESVDFSRVVPLSRMTGDIPEDTEALQKMSEEAIAFLGAFDWCNSIRDAYFGCGVGSIVAIFLFRIVPMSGEIDEWFWVIVGDLPPAYLVIDESRTPSEALRTYIAEMRRWVAAAEAGEPVNELIPVNVPASFQAALALKTRLDFLESRIVDFCR